MPTKRERSPDETYEFKITTEIGRFTDRYCHRLSDVRSLKQARGEVDELTKGSDGLITSTPCTKLVVHFSNNADLPSIDVFRAMLKQQLEENGTQGVTRCVLNDDNTLHCVIGKPIEEKVLAFSISISGNNGNHGTIYSCRNFLSSSNVNSTAQEMYEHLKKHQAECHAKRIRGDDGSSV